jgi:hypothetical protein
MNASIGGEELMETHTLKTETRGPTPSGRSVVCSKKCCT